ncbi:MAG: FtsX-like permease family protein [Treponema sp.]
MFLIKSAWDNIQFHIKRSILSILLIAIASGAILLYRGFVEYSEQGLALGFIADAGHIQVSPQKTDGTENTEQHLLDADALARLKGIYAAIPEIKSYDSVLNFQGIIGTEDRSALFWGSGYDTPESFGATEGIPVFAGEYGIVLGKGLFNSLHLSIEDSPIVNIMSSIGQSGILTGSLDVTGYLDTRVPQNDAGLVIASRNAMIKFFELEDSASYTRVFLHKDSDVPKVQAALDNYFTDRNLPFETRNWKELNPSWEQISGLFNAQFSVISAILCILIFVALTQSLSASFMERIGEFGTMEAIGLKKSAIIKMLLLEICMLSIAGIIGGIIFAQSGNIITETFDIMMIPPGRSSGYRLNFYITWQSIVYTQFFIFLTGIASVCYPIYTIHTYSTVQLIRYN